MSSAKLFLMLASLTGFVGVALGAFGAHALKARLSAEMLAIFETGVRYQMYHTFALLAVGILMLTLMYPRNEVLVRFAGVLDCLCWLFAMTSHSRWRWKSGDEKGRISQLQHSVRRQSDQTTQAGLFFGLKSPLLKVFLWEKATADQGRCFVDGPHRAFFFGNV